MNFLDHTINWCRGEIFEAKIILAFGLAIIAFAVLFYTTGSTPNAKAMLFPLLALGLLFTGSGGTMVYSNTKRIADFSAAYEKDPTAFIQSEKERADAFISWYPKIRYTMAAVALVGILLFLFWATPIGRSIGMGLMLMGLSTFVIDHFSEERAEIYHEEIVKAVGE